MACSPTSPILLVDGYNIIGAWSELKSLRDRDDLESARDHLINVLMNYTAAQGYQTKIVFDAHFQTSPKYWEQISSYLSVYYTAYGETADTFIEKFCASNIAQGGVTRKRVIVATSDRAQQLTVSGYGAEWRSAQQLAHDIALAKRKTRTKQRSRSKSQRRLFHNLDSQAQQKLAQMRHGSF